MDACKWLDDIFEDFLNFLKILFKVSSFLDMSALDKV